MSNVRIARVHGLQRAMTTTTADKSDAITVRLAMTTQMREMTGTSMTIAIATIKIREAIEHAALRSTPSIAAAATRKNTDLHAHTATVAATVAASIGDATALDQTHCLQKTSTRTKSRIRVGRAKARRISIASGTGLGTDLGTGTATGEIEKIATTTTKSTVRAIKRRRRGAVATATKQTIASTTTKSTVPRGVAGKIATASVIETMKGNLHQLPLRVPFPLHSTRPLAPQQIISLFAVPADQKHLKTCRRLNHLPVLAASNPLKDRLLIATDITAREASALRLRHLRRRHHRTTMPQNGKRMLESATVWIAEARILLPASRPRTNHRLVLRFPLNAPVTTSMERKTTLLLQRRLAIATSDVRAVRAADLTWLVC
jgi:hypothetical protein